MKVQKRMCSTCIYRPDSPLNLAKLEDDVREKGPGGRPLPYEFFQGYRACHHDVAGQVCCRGFWERHKDQFSLGQIAQRLNIVRFVEVNTLESGDRMSMKSYLKGQQRRERAADPMQAAVDRANARRLQPVSGTSAAQRQLADYRRLTPQRARRNFAVAEAEGERRIAPQPVAISMPSQDLGAALARAQSAGRTTIGSLTELRALLGGGGE